MQGANLVSFDQLIGQSALTARLVSALAQGRVAHAVIFAGPSGLGKRTLASTYARALLCSAAGEKPCNACPACRKALDGNHPDLHVVKPEEKGKSIGVDDARGILHMIDVRPYEGGRAVVIIENAHDMTPQAQNALLKTLEEPPEHVILLLLADSLSPLLPTILSRCAVFTLKRLNEAQMMSVLQSRGYSPDSKTGHAAAMADGRPGRALELLADDVYWALKDKAMLVLEQLIAGHKLAEAMKFAQDNRSRPEDFLSVWESALRDAAVAVSASDASLLTGEAKSFLKGTGLERLLKMLTACAGARKALEGNAIYAMTMDNLMIELAGGI